MQLGIFARKYFNKNSLSDHKKLVFLSLIAHLPHLLTVAIEENERIGQIFGDRNSEFFLKLKYALDTHLNFIVNKNSLSDIYIKESFYLNSFVQNKVCYSYMCQISCKNP